MQMPSQEEFVEMTSVRNGHCINGHDSAPGTAVLERGGWGVCIFTQLNYKYNYF